MPSNSLTHRALEVIYQTMRERGVTQYDLADALGVSQSRVSEFLAGKGKRLADEDLEGLARLFGCKIVISKGDGGVLAYLVPSSRLVPERWQKVLTYLELDVCFVPLDS